MNLTELPITIAVLEKDTFIPGKDGKGFNLKRQLNVNDTFGKEYGLKMTLLGTMVAMQLKGEVTLLPISKFDLLRP